MRLLLILLLLAASVAQAAPEIVKVNVWMNKNETVTPEYLKVTLGTPDMPDTGTYPYKMVWADRGQLLYSSYINPNFRRVGTYEDVDSVLVTEKLPYRGNYGKVRISRFNGTRELVLWSYDLAQLCNHDLVCNYYENYLSCPSDCALNIPDTVCVPSRDGICDPDCEATLDPDCAKAEPSTDYLPIIITALIVLCVAAIIWIRRPKKKKKPQRSFAK